MPVYEYECGACGHQFEESQRITDAPIKTCPKCAKDEVQRLISRTSFSLKGGGWYSDLYSSSKGGAKTGGAAPAAAGSSTESKPSGGDKGGGTSTGSSDGGGTKSDSKAGTAK